MAFELVPLAKPYSQDSEPDDGWNYPPVNLTNALPDAASAIRRDAEAEKRAEQDMAFAQNRGDGTFAKVRETDLAELRQRVWDWGDFRTWAIIAAMCLGFLAFCLLVYLLPANQAPGEPGGHAAPPGIRVY